MESTEGSTTAHTVLRMLTASWTSRALYTAAKLGVADAIQRLGGSAVPVQSIAEHIAVDPGALHRVLRALASAGVFLEAAEPDGPRYSLTPISEHLLTDSPTSLRHAALMYGEEMSLAWHELPGVLKDGQPAWRKVLGSDHFSYYQHHSESALVFDHAMKELGRAMYDDAALASSYDFSGVFERGATLVDVGGGLGRLLGILLQRGPSFRGILYDMAHVIANARRFHEASDASEPLAGRQKYAQRLSFESGNFFERVPAGADAYVLKRVLHDWNDDQCVTILRNIARVMKPAGRVLVMELVIPSGDEDHFGKWLDLNMMVVTGGRERTREEFAGLFEEAGLELRDVHRSSTLLHVVEASRRV